MNSVTKSAKSVNEAIEAALNELGISEEQAEIEVINEGNKGFLGILGKEATVKVTAKEFSAEEYAKNMLSEIIDKMGIEGTVYSECNDDVINLRVEGDKMGILIGRRGETLNSLQYIISLAVNKKTTGFVRVLLDTENYKKKREETLVNLANRLAENAVRYKRNITLDPMSSYERRIIHASLQDNKMVTTYSTGEEPSRKVVIAYKGRQ